MSLATDILLILAVLGAAAYCRLLAVRLKKLGDSGSGLNVSISTLNVQVEEMQRTLLAVRTAAAEQNHQLEGLTVRAEGAARNLELYLSSIHQDPIAQGAAGQAALILGSKGVSTKVKEGAGRPMRSELRAHRGDRNLGPPGNGSVSA